MAATGHCARWKHTWPVACGRNSAEARKGWGGGRPDQVFLLRAVCTVIPHWAPSQLTPRLIELQGLIKPHYRAFISAPIGGWVMDMIKHSHWMKLLKFHLFVWVCKDTERNKKTERHRKNAMHIALLSWSNIIGSANPNDTKNWDSKVSTAGIILTILFWGELCSQLAAINSSCPLGRFSIISAA